MANKANPYTYFGMTVSVCPTCHRVIPANLLEKDGKVYLSKTCPDHGRFKSVIASDAAWYHAAQRQTSPSLMLRQYQTETVHGCPSDCGACPEHQQNNAVPVIEITNICNLDCPICFADNHNDYLMSTDELEKCLDVLDASDSDVDLLVLSGGEPTAHPQLLDLIARCYRRPRIPRVGIATNGILIGKKDALARSLAEAGAYVLFQLDSLDPRKNQILRGDEMTAFREATLEKLEKYAVRTSILMTVMSGVNDDEIGDLLRLTLSKPWICGFEVQTMSYTGAGGRKVAFDPMTRVTGTDLIHNAEEQSGGIVRMSDFMPMPHPHPNCVAITYVLILLDGTPLPFPRFTDPATYREAIASEFVAEPEDKHEAFLRDIIDRVFSRASEIEKADLVLATLRRMLCDLYPAGRTTTREERVRLVQRYVKNVFLHNYMDDHSFDAAVLRKCTSMQIIPDGRMIPQCGYRVIHRKSDPRWQKARPSLGHGSDGLRRMLTVLD